MQNETAPNERAAGRSGSDFKMATKEVGPVKHDFQSVAVPPAFLRGDAAAGILHGERQAASGLAQKNVDAPRLGVFDRIINRFLGNSVKLRGD